MYCRTSSLLALIYFCQTLPYLVCPEVDILFLSDTESIKQNGGNIIKLIDNIVDNASSEHAGFSAHLYGDDIPHNMHPNIIQLLHTAPIQVRAEERSEIYGVLNYTFAEIQNYSIGHQRKSVGIIDASQALYLPEKPHRTNKHHHPSTVIEDEMDGTTCDCGCDMWFTMRMLRYVLLFTVTTLAQISMISKLQEIEEEFKKKKNSEKKKNSKKRRIQKN